MDWTQTLTIIGVFAAFFIYLMTRMDSNKSEMKNELKEFRAEVNQRFSEINQRFTSIETENKEISNRISTIEGMLMPRKVVHLRDSSPEDEPKEN